MVFPLEKGGKKALAKAARDLYSSLASCEVHSPFISDIAFSSSLHACTFDLAPHIH